MYLACTYKLRTCTLAPTRFSVYVCSKQQCEGWVLYIFYQIPSHVEVEDNWGAGCIRRLGPMHVHNEEA